MRFVEVLGHFSLTRNGFPEFAEDFTLIKIRVLNSSDAALRDTSKKLPCARRLSKTKKFSFQKLIIDRVFSISVMVIQPSFGDRNFVYIQRAMIYTVYIQ